MRKTLEHTLGYYNFGTNFFVLSDDEYPHQHYVAHHERIHLNIGASTTLGVFQQFMSYLAFRSPVTQLREAANRCLAASVNECRDVHEAAATFCELNSAAYHGYSGLSEMEANLPTEYREWRDIFDKFFNADVPIGVRGTLAYHLARAAMGTDILVDCRTPSLSLLTAFPAYIGMSQHSPNRRLRVLLSVIEPKKQIAVFSETIACFQKHENDLREAYRGRSFENRKTSHRIQALMFESFNADLARLKSRLPFSVRNEKDDIDLSCREMIEGWKSFSRDQQHVGEIGFRFENTDGMEVDVFDGAEIVQYVAEPLTNLYAIDDVAKLPRPMSNWIAVVYHHTVDEPFLLTEKPTRRVLLNGQFYVRYFPKDGGRSLYFNIFDSRERFDDLFGQDLGAVVIPAGDFERVRAKFVPNEKMPVLALWRNHVEFAHFNALGTIVGLFGSSTHSESIWYYFLRDTRGFFHILRDIAKEETVLELLLNHSPAAQPMNPSGQQGLSEFLSVAMRFPKHLLQ